VQDAAATTGHDLDRRSSIDTIPDAELDGGVGARRRSQLSVTKDADHRPARSVEVAGRDAHRVHAGHDDMEHAVLSAPGDHAVAETERCEVARRDHLSLCSRETMEERVASGGSHVDDHVQTVTSRM
jgi:hypothetical protein